MPKVRRAKIPEPVMRHLLRRAAERGITGAQLGELSLWLATDPNVPDARWFKRFPTFILCGERDIPKTFLIPGQIPDGQEVF
jgi:hypothetical protein